MMDKKHRLQAYRRRLGVMKRWCFTPRQAAEALGVTRWAVYYHLREGHLRKRKLGGRIFIAKWEVENLKARNANRSLPPTSPEPQDISDISFREFLERFVDLSVAASRLGIKICSLRYHFRRGNLTPYIRGGFWFVEKNELEGYVRKRRGGACFEGGTVSRISAERS